MVPSICFIDDILVFDLLQIINPIAYGGGVGFLAHAIRLAARTLEPFHLSDFSFMPFGHIVAKFQVN